MINLDSESEISTKSNCNIVKINESYYSLICELKDNIKADLQSAISFINDEEILLVNFRNGNSTLTTNNPYRKYFSENSSLKPGIIVAIVLPIVFVLVVIICCIFICLKNKKNKDKNEASSKNESTNTIVKF